MEAVKMRTVVSFNRILNQNIRVKINNKDFMLESVDDLFTTIDAINALSRGEMTLSNNYMITQYEIHKYLESFIYPDSVVIVSGISNADYLDRDGEFYEFSDSDSGKILTPAEFREAQVYLLSLMRVYAKDDDFVQVSRSEKILSEAEASNYSVQGKVPCENTLWPIPITVTIKKPKYLNVAIDDEFITEWLLNNFFNKVLSSK
jgi:hypothetical protein